MVRLLGMGVLAVCLSACVNGRDAPTPIALQGVTVVGVRAGRLLADQTVVVKGERIASVGPSGTIRPRSKRETHERPPPLTPGVVHTERALTVAYVVVTM